MQYAIKLSNNSNNDIFMKKLWFLACFMLSMSAFSQDSLTKEQMYEDFDHFCYIMKNANPQLEVRKRVTGVDIMEKIYEKRALIDTISDDRYFFDILSDAIIECNDEHCNPVVDSVRFSQIFNGDTLIVNRLIRKFRSTKSVLPYDYKPIMISAFYDNDNYYNMTTYLESMDSFDCRKKIVDSVPIGAKIISVNGIPIHDIIKVNRYRSRWDNKRKKVYFHGRALYTPNNIGIDSLTVDYEYNGKLNKFVSSPDTYCLGTGGGGYFYASHGGGYAKYIDKEKALYIRLPIMFDDQSDVIIPQIHEECRGKEINKVIIDIRGNPGGSDDVWERILSHIIRDTIKVDANIIALNTKPVRDALVERYGDTTFYECDTVVVPLLGNREYLSYKWGNDIVPTKESLNYTGKIYLLQNFNIYSSAGSFSNVANLFSDQIVTVGEPTGCLLGFGEGAFSFVLPNSNYIFEFNMFLDNTRVSKVYDFYHDNVEIPVEIPISDRVLYDKFYRDSYTIDFLMEKDYLFRKVLEM